MIEDKKQSINLSINTKNKDFLWDLFKTGLLFIGLFYIIRLFIFAPFIVWGISMQPVLQHGDYLIVDRSPRFRTPQPGEIIIFQNPSNPNEKLIKRISKKKFENNEYKFWVLGDNKQHSIDSRNFGYVNKNHIFGRVFLRLWPNFTLNFEK